MGVETRIAWASHSFNPWRGCTKVSEGCANCYAEALSKRNPAVLGGWGPNGKRAMAAESAWREPSKWNKAARDAGERRRVFFSLGDVFEARPELQAPRARLLETIHRTPNLDWLLLTKRPGNWRPIMEELAGVGVSDGDCLAEQWLYGAVMPNIWLGVSCENQEYADRRIPLLLHIPAAVRFVSAEPLLGPIEFRPGWLGLRECDCGGMCVECCYSRRAPSLDWIIVGGESGPDRRPCKVEWIADIARQSTEAGRPVFVKQDSGPRDGMQGRIPDDLWNLKQFPRPA